MAVAVEGNWLPPATPSPRAGPSTAMAPSPDSAGVAAGLPSPQARPVFSAIGASGVVNLDSPPPTGVLPAPSPSPPLVAVQSPPHGAVLSPSLSTGGGGGDRDGRPDSPTSHSSLLSTDTLDIVADMLHDEGAATMWVQDLKRCAEKYRRRCRRADMRARQAEKAAALLAGGGGGGGAARVAQAAGASPLAAPQTQATPQPRPPSKPLAAQGAVSPALVAPVSPAPLLSASHTPSTPAVRVSVASAGSASGSMRSPRAVVSGGSSGSSGRAAGGGGRGVAISGGGGVVYI